ncbi:MAG: DNA-directed RNA polymerase subunit alpha [Candidatus Cloacimonetes bacterium]|nr:DNA-directed RNA polymerase subunit alpha [Candidatus Cloacimonadota bacterium]
MTDLQPIQMPKNIEMDKESSSEKYGKFSIGPMEKGFGTTIGNSLRRVLLASIQGGAVCFVRVKDITHQYSAIPGSKNDYVDLILNLKNLIMKIDAEKEIKLELNAKGPGKISAKNIKSPKTIEIINKDLLLLELVENVDFSVELWVSNGIGYRRENEQKLGDKPVGVIPIDAIFSPVRKVNFHIEKQRVDEKIDYDKLILEIWTDGSITPEDALSLASKILKDYFKSIIQFKKEPEYITPDDVDPKLKNLQKLMRMKVSDLELTVRCRNCLSAAKIKKVKGLVTKSESQMLKFRNFGKKSLDEIKIVLERYGLKMGMDINDIEAKLATLKKVRKKK